MKTIKNGASPIESRELEELRLRRIEVGGKNVEFLNFFCQKRSALKVEQSYFAKRSLSPVNCGTLIRRGIGMYLQNA